MEHDFRAALTRIFIDVDEKCAKQLRLIRALAERDRRAIGQLPRMDWVMKRINK